MSGTASVSDKHAFVTGFLPETLCQFVIKYDTPPCSYTNPVPDESTASVSVKHIWR